MPEATLLSTRTVYTGRIFTVTVDRVRLPHGVEHDMELVRHRGSVVLLPIPKPGSLILVKQYRYAVGRDLWELPAGSLNEGEDALEAAARECHEEIGMVPGKLTRIGAMFPTPGFCDEEMGFYLAEDLREPEEAAAQDEDEQLEPKAFRLEEIDRMAQRGEIDDMKTIAGLALLRRYRG